MHPIGRAGGSVRRQRQLCQISTHWRHPEWRQAVVGWLSRRFDLSDALFEETTQILPVNGTREGLFMAAQIAPQKTMAWC